MYKDKDKAQAYKDQEKDLTHTDKDKDFTYNGLQGLAIKQTTMSLHNK